MIIDTHAHLDFKDYKEDREEVIKRSLKEKVQIINVGVDYETSKNAVDLAEKYDIFASVGLHPSSNEDFNSEKYEKLAKSKNVVMIGETGLDYLRKSEKQKETLIKQIKLAFKLGLPLNFHCRKAHDDLIEILEEFKPKGIIHCFTGNIKQADKYLEMGFYLGLNGIIFKLDLENVIKKIPLSRIVLETDSPYLAPPGFKRNKPVFIKKIAERISEIKEVSLKELIKNTTKNTKQILKI